MRPFACRQSCPITQYWREWSTFHRWNSSIYLPICKNPTRKTRLMREYEAAICRLWKRGAIWHHGRHPRMRHALIYGSFTSLPRLLYGLSFAHWMSPTWRETPQFGDNFVTAISYIVGRNIFLLLLYCSAWPYLGPSEHDLQTFFLLYPQKSEGHCVIDPKWRVNYRILWDREYIQTFWKSDINCMGGDWAKTPAGMYLLSSPRVTEVYSAIPTSVSRIYRESI